MPSQMPELEWVTTQDLATEILRRCDAVISVSQMTPGSDTMSIYKKGSFHQTLVILSAAASEITKAEA